ncbi:MAG TPA: adenosylcobinamide-phosphate synthase CbiB [Steroidobacteraceae bacterium]|nr:adenosylcobinamide-phosphate synthase CbiB [Steroidobacteraceae bacterium]
MSRRNASGGITVCFPQSAVCSVLPLAFGVDLLLGEPPSAVHPVVWIGAAIDALERHAPGGGRRAGLAYGGAATLGLVCATAGVAFVVESVARRLPRPARVAVLALSLKPAFALRMLLHTAQDVRDALEAGELGEARAHLCSLVSRDTVNLSAEECAAAAIEALAENLTDSVAGPWLGYALAGLPGAWLFRAANTLDSRWGYHGRYEYLGRVAARLDDMLAWVPARVSAILLIVAAPSGGGSILCAWRMMRRDHHLTESPNAGWTISTMAGALGRRLAKRGQYVLNAEGAACSPDDIRRAERIVRTAAFLGLLGAAGFRDSLLRRFARCRT